jgi:hypothetical protein
MTLFRLLFTAFGWVVLGILVMALGVMLFRDGAYRPLPEREALKPVEGVVESVSKLTKKKTFGDGTLTTYEVKLRTADGGAAWLSLPEDKITDQMANSLNGASVTALPRGTRGGVWELKAGDATLIDFDVERQRFADSLAAERWQGPLAIAGGLVIMLAGIYRLYRRRRAARAYA